MCIIIDANVACEFSGDEKTQDAESVWHWLVSKKGKLAIGGKLTEELSKTKFRQKLRELNRAGIALVYPSEAVDAEERVVKATRRCVSNDPHVIALARISGCRLLFSRDEDLHADFKNRELLKNPKGRVYTSAAQKPLLRKCCECNDAHQ